MKELSISTWAKHWANIIEIKEESKGEVFLKLLFMEKDKTLSEFLPPAFFRIRLIYHHLHIYTFLMLTSAVVSAGDKSGSQPLLLLSIPERKDLFFLKSHGLVGDTFEW